MTSHDFVNVKNRQPFLASGPQHAWGTTLSALLKSFHDPANRECKFFKFTAACVQASLAGRGMNPTSNGGFQCRREPYTARQSLPWLRGKSGRGFTQSPRDTSCPLANFYDFGHSVSPLIKFRRTKMINGEGFACVQKEIVGEIA